MTNVGTSAPATLLGTVWNISRGRLLQVRSLTSHISLGRSQREPTDVFNAVSEEIPFALIPQENSFFGTVTETYDLLRLPEVGQQKFVRGETTHAVRHSLLVRRGVKLENVQRVMSHEQVGYTDPASLSSRILLIREHLGVGPMRPLPLREPPRSSARQDAFDFGCRTGTALRRPRG